MFASSSSHRISGEKDSSVISDSSVIRDEVKNLALTLWSESEQSRDCEIEIIEIPSSSSFLI